MFVKGGVWHLFYERCDRGVWLATTRDPVAGPWVNVQDDPVVAMGPGAYDQFAVAFDQVFERDGVYYAYYHANAHNPWQPDWTTNLARSADLIHWEKYPHNPLIDEDSSSSVLVVPPGSKSPRLYTMHPEVRVFELGGPDPSPGQSLISKMASTSAAIPLGSAATPKALRAARPTHRKPRPSGRRSR